MVLLARSAADAQTAWQLLQQQFAELRLVVNHEKSRLTTLAEGFSFLGFDFRSARCRPYLWPRQKARGNILQRVRDTVRSFRSSERLDQVIKKLNPILIGWCTYFRVGHSNRVFHKIDRAVRQELQLWQRRKHRCSWRTAQSRWHYRFLHDRCGPAFAEHGCRRHALENPAATAAPESQLCPDISCQRSMPKLCRRPDATLSRSPKVQCQIVR